MRSSFLITLCALAFVLPRAHAEASLTYRERTGAREITTVISIERLADGMRIHSLMSDGDTHLVEVNASGATISYRVASPARKTDYAAYREGNTIRVQGTLGGRPLFRVLPIDARPWYETLERSLCGYALSRSATPVLFWIVHPWEARAYLLQGRWEAEQDVQVNDRAVAAMRVRVGPVGVLSLFWSTLYWFRSSDGRFLRYEGVRGLPGTPKTVVELIGGG